MKIIATKDEQFLAIITDESVENHATKEVID
jgi:hypothetical protein